MKNESIFKIAVLSIMAFVAASLTVAAEDSNYLLSADASRTVIDETLANGTWDAELGLKFRYEDPEEDEDGSAGWGYLEVDWESGVWNGLQLGVGGLAILEAWDEGGYEGNIFGDDDDFQDHAKWTDIYLKYAVPNTKTEILVGRTKFKKPTDGDGDVHQGIQLTIKDIPRMTIYASAVNKWMDNASASWDLDGIQDEWVDMDEVNSKDHGNSDAGSFAYTLMADIDAVPDMLTLSPYMQYQKDVATTLGVEFDIHQALNEDLTVGLNGAYVKHLEDTPDDMYPDDEDVSQSLLRAYGKYKNFGLGVGYYHISGDIALYNDTGAPGDDFQSVYIMDEFDPMAEDLAKYGEAPNNDTFFVDASYSWKFLELEAIYGWVDNAWVKSTGEAKGEATELNLIMNIAISENLEAEIGYIRVDDNYSDDGDDSTDIVAGGIAYSF
ncbi:MAG: major outer membrane protein [Lentisphaeria bacterium]